MSDDEVIRFEITDYDLDNEFNPNRQRKAKKEHQIYGIPFLLPLTHICHNVTQNNCQRLFKTLHLTFFRCLGKRQ